MNIFADCTKLYPTTKTLSFGLQPQWETMSYLQKNNIIELDKHRQEDMKSIQKLFIKLYQLAIKKGFATVVFPDLHEYANLLLKKKKTSEEWNQLKQMKTDLRFMILKEIQKFDGYHEFFKGKAFELLYQYNIVQTEQEYAVIDRMQNTRTLMYSFWNSQKALFSPTAKTGIAFRCIDTNLTYYIKNSDLYYKIKEQFTTELEQLQKDMFPFFSSVSSTITGIDQIFETEYYHYFLSQKGIDLYNLVIGGYSKEDGTKIKGLNEYINLYNQKNRKKDKQAPKLPVMTSLKNQILGGKQSVSFIPEKFKSDQELLDTVYAVYKSGDDAICRITEDVNALFADLASINPEHLYYKIASVEWLSKKLFGDYYAVKKAWSQQYDTAHMKAKIPKKYYETRERAYKKEEYLSLAFLQQVEDEGDPVAFLSKYVCKLCTDITEAYQNASYLLERKYPKTRKLYQNDTACALIQRLLDKTKQLKNALQAMEVSDDSMLEKDSLFYTILNTVLTSLQNQNQLYNAVRNYLTQKDNEKNNVNMTFGASTFLDGWTNPASSRAALLRDHTNYYLAILSKGSEGVKKLESAKKIRPDEDVMELIDYQKGADVKKSISNLLEIDGQVVMERGKKEHGTNEKLERQCEQYLPKKIYKIRTEKSYINSSKNFRKEDLTAYIAYYQKLASAYYYKNGGFSLQFMNAEDYESFDEFKDHIEEQVYRIQFKKVSAKAIRRLVSDGSIYLFRLWTKDFSEKSHGAPNLNTLYFQALFDKHNLKSPVFQLNGKAKMFFRPATLDPDNPDDFHGHRANEPIPNKNKYVREYKETSTFPYHIVKDQHKMHDSFELKLTISLNCFVHNKVNMNTIILNKIRAGERPYVIGIDRGERNLITICVIDWNYNIVEQRSLNEIESKVDDRVYRTDYHELLVEREKEIQDTLKSWAQQKNIKNLKKGYLSQVVHVIHELVLKYNAVLSLENLNYSFKQSRQKIGYQVYQNFENALQDKFSFLCTKSNDPNVLGGIYQAYQLVNPRSSAYTLPAQNGIIFYVPAPYTSNIDPVTGFTKRTFPKYKTIEQAREYFQAFNGIEYVPDENMFKFTIDYAKLPKANFSPKSVWDVWSNGERITVFRNPDKGNHYDYRVVNLTEELKALFTEYGIDYTKGLQDQIVHMNSKDFFINLMRLFSLTIQMRNSLPGTDVDYIISPVKNSRGVFYDSRVYALQDDAALPQDGDKNGAYNTARKCMMILHRFAEYEGDPDKFDYQITNDEWMRFAQHV